MEAARDSEHDSKIYRIVAPLGTPDWLRVDLHGPTPEGRFVEARTYPPGPMWQDIIDQYYGGTDDYDDQEYAKRVHSKFGEAFIRQITAGEDPSYPADLAHRIAFARNIYETTASSILKTSARFSLSIGTTPFDRNTAEEAFSRVDILYKGSPVWLYDIKNSSPEGVCTLWTLIQLGARPDPDHTEFGPSVVFDRAGWLIAEIEETDRKFPIKRKLWLMSEDQWNEGEWPPESQGGPPYSYGMSSVREASEAQEATRRFWRVEWINPESGNREIYQSQLSQARADRLAYDLRLVYSPKWFGVNAPTFVVPDSGAHEARDYVDPATGAWKEEYAIAPRFTPEWLRWDGEAATWPTQNQWTGNEYVVKPIVEPGEEPDIVEITLPSFGSPEIAQLYPHPEITSGNAETRFREHLLWPGAVRSGYKRDDSYKGREWRTILPAINIQHEGSPVAWYDPDYGFVRFASLWDLAHLKQGVPQDEWLAGEIEWVRREDPEREHKIKELESFLGRPLWLLSMDQFDNARFPPPIKGGPPFSDATVAMVVASEERALVREAKKKRELNIDNEEDVMNEMAKALDVDVNELSIYPGNRYGNYDGSMGTIWQVDLGDQEYFVVADDTVARDLAIELVKQDLEESPENFNPDFIRRHIDTENLVKQLRPDVLERTRENLKEADPYDFWSNAENAKVVMYIPEEDEDGERRDPTSEEIDALAEDMTDENLSDPVQYLIEVSGEREEDMIKQAIKIGGIDVDAAAKEAVRDDGAGNFLRTYDGETHETPGGFTYWQNG